MFLIGRRSCDARQAERGAHIPPDRLAQVSVGLAKGNVVLGIRICARDGRRLNASEGAELALSLFPKSLRLFAPANPRTVCAGLECRSKARAREATLIPNVELATATARARPAQNLLVLLAAAAHAGPVVPAQRLATGGARR
jgi:hypothetical protein